ncbi:MAG: chloride channel protein [Acidobacteria bacterium]|nr:chloride channel protein [Acidobacteriota bacterium]
MSLPLFPLAQRLRIRENQIFLGLTVLIGVIAGLAAVLFTLAIESTQDLLFGFSPSWWRLLVVPLAASLGAGFLLVRFFPEARGSGVPQTEAAFHLEQGIIPARVPIGKFLTGVLCVGSGHSLGREGPSVQIGAGIASAMGRWFKLSPSRVQNLVPVGAAAALSAAFNTPVAAVLFALEEIIGDMNAALIGSTVVASVTAVIVERSILGHDALFRVPAYQLVHPVELIAYGALGVAGGLISLLFCKGLLRARQWFLHMPSRSRLFQPAMGGLFIGILLLFFPEVMGVGYEYVDQALNGGLVWRTMLLLCFAKLAATIISYASGNAGGIFAPSLYLGAMLGGAVGVLVHSFAPFPTGEPGAYALVGMGALFAGIIRAPMTSVFMVFELTQDYQILVPLMVANMLSFLISRRYQPVPIYHALLEQDHIHLPPSGTRLAGGAVRVRQLMTQDITFVPEEASVESAWRLVQAQSAPCLLVGSRPRLVGLVSYPTLQQAMESGKSAEPVSQFLTDGWTHVHPDHSVEVALDRFRQNPGLLPVVSRRETSRVEGVITRQTILNFLESKPEM